MANEGCAACLELSGALTHPSLHLEAEASVLGALPPPNLKPQTPTPTPSPNPNPDH